MAGLKVRIVQSHLSLSVWLLYGQCVICSEFSERDTLPLWSLLSIPSGFHHSGNAVLFDYDYILLSYSGLPNVYDDKVPQYLNVERV
jgi:hypothetical protein